MSSKEKSCIQLISRLVNIFPGAIKSEKSDPKSSWEGEEGEGLAKYKFTWSHDTIKQRTVLGKIISNAISLVFKHVKVPS